MISDYTTANAGGLPLYNTDVIVKQLKIQVSVPLCVKCEVQCFVFEHISQHQFHRAFPFIAHDSDVISQGKIRFELSAVVAGV